VSWERYIERLREDPSDAEALDALEAHLAARKGATPGERAAQVGAGARFGFRMFLGPPLYKAIVVCWDAWSAYLRGGSQGEWPEAPTRDVTAAFAARFVRIGMLGLFLGLLPAIILGFQTAMMGIQLWQIQEQNRIVKEQNQLTRDQFGALYQPQFLGILYEDKGKSDPRLRAAALRALAQMNASQRADALEVDPEATPRALELDRVKLEKVALEDIDLSGARMDDASWNKATLRDVNLKGASLVNADMFSVTLERVDLGGADLTRANFNGATLSEVDLTGATIEKASFTNAKFTSVTCPDGSQAKAEGC
jgi:hypothetical protein